MRRLGRPVPVLELSADERGALENWARRPKMARATALRARLILGCAAGKTNTAVARELRVTKQTVGKWRSRFVAKRLEGLLDEPRPGAPRTVTDAAVERVVTTKRRSPSCGPRPPMRSSRVSPAFVIESRIQDTRAAPWHQRCVASGRWSGGRPGVAWRASISVRSSGVRVGMDRPPVRVGEERRVLTDGPVAGRSSRRSARSREAGAVSGESVG
jgi:Winged helix-turn helix